MTFIMEVLGWIYANLEAVLSFVGFFALIATMTKNKADDTVVEYLLKAINFFGANWGGASNRDEADAEEAALEAELDVALEAALEAELEEEV